MREQELLLQWLFDKALPLWSGTGVDRQAGGFFEKLTPAGQPTDEPRRARVVGRQVFSFANAAHLGWSGDARGLVRHGLNALFQQHLSGTDGIVVPLVAPGGAVLGTAFDLYDHAFVLFGLAAAHAIGEEPERLEAQATALLRRMRDGWRHPMAGFEEAQPRQLPLKANPHMHILEASLAWRETGGDPVWDALADEIAELCLSRFIEPESGALREYYDGDWRQLQGHEEAVVEPGHQYEWAWLLIRWGLLRGRPDALAIARRLIDLAENHGVDPARGMAVNELNADLTVRDGRARLWPQTERIKAHVALAGIETDPRLRGQALERAAQTCRGLLRFFEHPIPGSWWEHIDAQGHPVSEPARTSSLYHITCAIRVLVDGDRPSVPGADTGDAAAESGTGRRVPGPFDAAGRVISIARRRLSSPSDLPRLARRALALYREGGWSLLRGVVARETAKQEEELAGRGYDQWIERYDTLTPDDIAALRRQVAALPATPLISVIMPVYNTPQPYLEAAIDSVLAQVYPHWELCIADDASTAAHVRETLERYRAGDPRIQVVYRDKNGHIAHASNSALELANGEWIAPLDHDDVLRPHALYEVAAEIGRFPQATVIYSDEDKIDANGRRFDHFFKPDFGPETLLAMNYFNHLTVHRTALVRQAGGWRTGFEGSQDYDLNLRVVERVEPHTVRHIPKVLYHWRAAAHSTATSTTEKPYAWVAGQRALAEHLARTGMDAVVEGVAGTPFYRVRPAIARPEPLVSLIIPTRDGVDYLRGCIESIREKTTYRNYDIIVVDNGSTDPRTLAYLDGIAGQDDVAVLRYDAPFNYSAINNLAVRHAGGSLVGLINNDIEVISPDWLSEMVSWAAQPQIGCVGAKLVYGNDTLQHGGVILGLGGVAGHSHKHADRYSPGYAYRLRVLQNLSAVTAACLVVRKPVYEAVGGLDETHLKVAFNDVDFCLRVREAGYRNVWTPFAELYHLESVSRGAEDDPAKQARFRSEIRTMQRRWGERLLNDPFYSPNLTADREDFTLAFPPRLRAFGG
ncbi:AGE family epimerase/isomerase [Pseudochelatococcus sp. B33]